jgi:hypothetical protein
MYQALIMAIALSTSATPAADSGHCDSKPFTLKKAAPAPAKPGPPALVAPAPKPAPKIAAAKPAKPKKNYEIGCKQPKD